MSASHARRGIDVTQLEQHGDWRGSTATLKPGSMSALACYHQMRLCAATGQRTQADLCVPSCLIDVLKFLR
jgi:hypothetical protein